MKRFKTESRKLSGHQSPFSKKKYKDLFCRIRGIPLETDLSSYQETVTRIKAAGLSSELDSELRDRSKTLIAHARSGVLLDSLLEDAFTLVREASKRGTGLDPHDVQVIAGLVLHHGRIVELPTGEGKTLAAVFPAYLNALSGKGCHVLTFNDYLARRDAAWMGPIYTLLGLSVGCIQEGMSATEKRRAYACDVTYATARESGFDFLRDHLCYREEDVVHRPFHFALVDEADSILIDEARVPLVIAGIAGGPKLKSSRLARLAKTLIQGKDYETDEKKRNVYLTDVGVDHIERLLDCGNLHVSRNIGLLTAVNCALHAEVLLERDRDYIVRSGRIEIVDEFTGRVADKRHWPDGLQAAVEAKEQLGSRSNGRVLGSITLQHFLNLYPRLCGMTATARSGAGEFKEFYGLCVTVIPPHQPCIRIDFPDRVFSSKTAKARALIDEVKHIHAAGRPILVGTGSVRESEELAVALRAEGISCRVLNAKNDEKEARIIARAGDMGAVTISTNMAGRGTDIKLGGVTEKNYDQVAALGGLYVTGTNRHESLRIDDQLRGRAGRQGDPGSSRFFVSSEDDLIKRFGIQKFIRRYSQSLGHEDMELRSSWINREIRSAQRSIEGQNFEIRKSLWEYSSLIEMQRQEIHGLRQAILLSDSRPSLLEKLWPMAYQTFVKSSGKDRLRKLEKQVSLGVLDKHWADHLAFIADLRESIHLVRVAGITPLEEFYRQATQAFLGLKEQIEREKRCEMLNRLSSLSGPDLDETDFTGPSSTWTYLIDDDQYSWGLEMLRGRNIGFTAGAAAFTGPLYLLLGIYHRFFKKNCN